jgi:hypothetical protein
MFLLMVVVAPIVGLISTFGIGIEPWPVGIVVLLLGFGGILRMIYALLFESMSPAGVTERRTTRELSQPPADFATSALPPQRDVPASQYASPRAGALFEPAAREPASVTDNTTKLLEKDPDANRN